MSNLSDKLNELATSLENILEGDEVKHLEDVDSLEKLRGILEDLQDVISIEE
jgi:hypothetical protein